MSHDKQDDSRPARDGPQSGGRTSIANRDRPVFTSMRHSQPYQQPPEFYTDSLNTSYASHIPSPSPARHARGGKSRQALGNRRGLAATHGAQREENRDNMSNLSSPTRSSSARFGQRSRGRNTPQLSTRNSPTPPISISQRESSGARTPSPSRGRHIDSLKLLSPTSDSSPPRGLAEAYQRIEDEEFLASQEGETSDDDTDTFDHDRALQDIPSNPLRLSWHSHSPESRRSSRRLSPRPPADVDQESTTELELVSRTSSPFDIVTEEDRYSDMASQHEKDEERVRGALASDVVPFKKGRQKGRSGLTVGNLRRQEGSSQSGSSSAGTPSTSSKSEFSLNIPAGWGRKGRGGRTWLNRITENGDLKTGELAKDSPLREPLQQSFQTSGPIVDWMEAAAATPLPAINSDSVLSPESPANGQTAVNSSQASRRIDLLRDDVKSRSQETSETPPGRIRTAAIDEIRAREIQSLEERGLTMNRLGEWKEKKSLERISRRSGSGSTNVSSEDKARIFDLAINSEFTPKPLSEEISEEELGLENDDQDPEPELPVATRNDGQSSHSSQILPNGEKLPSERPKHSRDDSREILRTLSRVESASPSPQRYSEDKSSNADDAPQEKFVFPKTQPQGLRKAGDTQQTQQPRHATRQRFSEVDTPYQSKPTTQMKTPVVTGAFVETPAPTVRHTNIQGRKDIAEQRALVAAALAELRANGTAEPNNIADSNSSPVKLEDTAPKLPGSALAAILEKAKRAKSRPTAEQDDTLQLDDSTIESLEDLLVFSDNEAAELKPEYHPESSPKKPPNQTTPMTAQKVRSNTARGNPALKIAPSDAESYSELASRLSHLKSSITDAKAGLGSLQKRLSSTPIRKPTRRLSTASNEVDAECNEGGEFHDFIWPCERCGCGGAAAEKSYEEARDGSLIAWQTVRVPMPRLWVWREGDWAPRVTRKGWWATAIVVLVVAELTVADAYTPPFHASTMVGFGVDIDAPKPPFVLLKLAWKRGLGALLMPLWMSLCVFVRLLAGVLGFSPGMFGHRDFFVAPEPKWIFEDAVEFGEEMALGADEFL